MATGCRLAAVVLLLAAARSAAGEPSWADPWITGETDEYIKSFDGDNAEMTIYEDVPVGHHIFTLHVDASQGDTADIATSSDPAGVQLETSGSPPDINVTTLTSLDYEKETDYIITNYLHGGNRQYVILHVADVNDNPPIFAGNIGSQVYLYVLENTVNDSLLVLGATDADAGATAELSYSLQTNNQDIFTLKQLPDAHTPKCQLQMVNTTDYESSWLYTMTITAKDKADDRGTQRNSSVTVFVNVKDASDTPPRWVKPAPTISMNESSDTGKVIFTVGAIDGDIGVNNNISYSITEQVPSGMTEINEKSGEVTLLKPLDREDPDILANNGFLSITVQAREAPSEDPDQPCTAKSCATTKGLITVIDLDDHPPAFSELEYRVTKPEGFTGSLGLAINVTDRDPTYDNGLFVITLEGAEEEGLFAMTSSKGAMSLITDVTVTKAGGDYLDYEKEDRRTVQFQVVATGDNVLRKSATATVIVTITDKNDNPPIFEESSYAKDVSEDITSGEKIMTVTATDADSTSEKFGNKSIRYSLSGAQASAVVINNVTGQISVAPDADTQFDYDQGSKTVKFTISATDEFGQGQVATAQVTLAIKDVDDTAPAIQAPSHAEVKENQNNALVTDGISGEDVDTAAVLEFHIDWEDSTATKDGTPVSKDDCDFTKWFAVETLPDKKAKLKVTDTPPDREKVDQLHLVVVVNDTQTVTGKSSAKATITVDILDVNDNDPVFTNVDESTKMNVTENMPPSSPIFPINAIDIDLNNAISYKISGDSTFTSLVKIGDDGQLKVAKLIDREQHPRINVTVTATDSGTPPRNTSVDISIEVLDQNDCLPQWQPQPSSLKLNVTEGKAGVPITELNATDDDQPGTAYSRITYGISADGARNFTVDNATGEVRVAGALDRELLADTNYVMTVRVSASDECGAGGICRHSIDGYLTVRVLDVNDCAPEFPPPDGSRVTVKESVRAGAKLKTLAATDADEAGTPAATLTYSLGAVNSTGAGCDADGLFAVATVLGGAELTAKTALQDCWGDYNVTLNATDGEDPFNSGTTVVQVHVDDVNDPPSFVSPPDGFALEIPENSFNESTRLTPVVLKNGTTLKVVAKDPDIRGTDNSRLFYRLLSTSTPPGATTIFDVDRDNGTLYLKSQIDSESKAGNTYQLKLQVEDQGSVHKADTMTLNVNVSDVDEFMPAFNKSFNYDTRFTEGQPSGVEVTLTSRAFDRDTTNIIFYYLVGGAKETFELVNSSDPEPRLRTKKRLDRESNGSYLLILATDRSNEYPGDVHVFDPSNPQLQLLNITVMDINDNTPTFGEKFLGGIAVGDDKSSAVVTVRADDRDLNETISYVIDGNVTASDPSIEPEVDGKEAFNLDPATGEVTRNFDVDKAMTGFFEFAVVATDKAGHTNRTTVRVFVITEHNRVKFVFANAAAFVTAQRGQVRQILTSVFGYTANIETIVASQGDAEATDMVTHFVDESHELPVDRDVIINMQFKDDVSKRLITELASRASLNLTRIGDTTVSVPPAEDTLFQMLLIVVASVMGGVLALTLITACIQTHKLRRQVKALSINAFGSKESGLQNAGLAVPGSNMFANQGANPIFTMDEKRSPDAESQSSGDSVLIGVEDDPEFKGFAPSSARPGRGVPVENHALEPDDEEPPAAFGNHRSSVDLPRGQLAPELGASGSERPALFDENSRHHMPQFEPDEPEPAADGGDPTSPFASSGTTQNPLFGGDETTQNPLFGADGTTENPLFGGDGTKQNPLFGGDGNFSFGGGEH